MITDRIGRHEVLLPINHKITISEKRRIPRYEKVKFILKVFTLFMVIEAKVVIG